MHSEVPRVDIWKTVQFTPPLVPDTILTPIVSVVDPHTVFMRVVARGDPPLASHMLMVERAMVLKYGALFRWWRFGLADDALSGVGAYSAANIIE